MQLTQQEKRIKIAEACGINIAAIREREGQNCPLHIPDYFNDLNAMHSAEERLTEELRPVFCLALDCVANNEEFSAEEAEWMWLERPCFGWFETFHATAEQHAEAFGKTLNLW